MSNGIGYLNTSNPMANFSQMSGEFDTWSRGWFTPLAVVLSAYFLVTPLLPSAAARYLTVPLALMLVVLALVTREWAIPRSAIVYIYLVAQLYAFLFHAFDVDSFLNIVGGTLCFMAAYVTVWKGVRRFGFYGAEHIVYRVLLATFLLMFPLSTALTAIHYPYAPSQYFWQVGGFANRLSLMHGSNEMGDATAGSDATWLAGFLLVLNEKYRREAPAFTLRWTGHLFVALMCCYVVVFSRQRMALLMLLESVLVFLAYKKIVRIKLFVLINVAMAAFYLVLSFSIPISLGVADLLEQAQRNFTFLRITNSGGGERSLLSSREILNVELVNEGTKHPILGQGHGTPILKYGVTGSGGVADRPEDKVAGTESGLRSIVAYGYPFFALLMLFMVWPWIQALRKKSPDPIIACGISGIVVLTFLTSGGFESWYTITLILGVMTILYGMSYPPHLLESDQELPEETQQSFRRSIVTPV